jgi:hypothetical protein
VGSIEDVQSHHSRCAVLSGVLCCAVLCYAFMAPVGSIVMCRHIPHALLCCAKWCAVLRCGVLCL